MKTSVALAMLSALAHDARLSAFRLLVQAGPQGMAAGALADHLRVAPSTLSFHLKDLRLAGLVEARRDGRSIIYVAQTQAAQVLAAFLAEGPAATPPPRVFNVLFLCTGNSARSIMAEAILNREGGGRFRAWSAGSHPRGAVHPQALRLLGDQGLPTDGLRSKSWDEFAAPGAPALDFVFTVCDDAAREACPLWPGQPISAHWGVPDPVGEDEHAFTDAFHMLFNRIGIFTCLPLGALDRLSLQSTLDQIGRKHTARGLP